MPKQLSLTERREEFVYGIILPSAFVGAAMGAVLVIIGFLDVLHIFGMMQFNIEAWIEAHSPSWYRAAMVASSILFLAPMYVVMPLAAALQGAKRDRFGTAIFSLVTIIMSFVLSGLMVALWVV